MAKATGLRAGIHKRVEAADRISDVRTKLIRLAQIIGDLDAEVQRLQKCDEVGKLQEENSALRCKIDGTKEHSMKALDALAEEWRKLCERVTLERDNLEIDMLDAETIMQRSLICAKTDDCDACNVEGEPLADALAFLKTHGWKDGKPPEQLREFVTKHRQQLDQKTDDANRHWADLKAEQVRCIEAEKAVTLMAEHYWTGIEVDGPGVLCEECTIADERMCGPGHPGEEPCKAFAKAEARHEKFAPVHKVLERMKA